MTECFDILKTIIIDYYLRFGAHAQLVYVLNENLVGSLRSYALYTGSSIYGYIRLNRTKTVFKNRNINITRERSPR